MPCTTKGLQCQWLLFFLGLRDPGLDSLGRWQFLLLPRLKKNLYPEAYPESMHEDMEFCHKTVFGDKGGAFSGIMSHLGAVMLPRWGQVGAKFGYVGGMLGLCWCILVYVGTF